jgi:hypothetical protein
MIMIVGVAPGALIKPEMFSLLCLNLVVGAYFRARLARDDEAAAIRWLYLVPLIVLFWVNAHGAVVLAAPFLAATALGEALNARLAPDAALSRRVFVHLVAAWALCVVALALTPYGPAYPIQLVEDLVLGRRARPDEAWNVAYVSMFHSRETLLHLAPVLAAILALLLAQGWRWAVDGPRGRRVDCVSILAIAACVPLYVMQVRSAYVLPVVAAYAITYMASRPSLADALPPDAADSPPRRRRRSRSRGWWRRAGPALPAAGAIMLALALGGRALHVAWYSPGPSSWIGFGINYANPVPEAEYLARNRLGPRLYNIFDSGGYLLWRLHPDYKVMVDSRSFPYLAWFEDQYRFTRGEIFEEFLQRYEGDTAIIDLAKSAAARNFMRSAAWRLVYYGPTAAVFVRRDFVPAAPLVDPAPERFRELRNAEVAHRVLGFAASAGDYKTAWAMLEQLESHLSDRADPIRLVHARVYRDAHLALRARDYLRAKTLFDLAFKDILPGDQDRLIMVFLERRIAVGGSPGNEAEARRYEAALEKLVSPEL